MFLALLLASSPPRTPPRCRTPLALANEPAKPLLVPLRASGGGAPVRLKDGRRVASFLASRASDATLLGLGNCRQLEDDRGYECAVEPLTFLTATVEPVFTTQVERELLDGGAVTTALRIVEGTVRVVERGEGDGQVSRRDSSSVGITGSITLHCTPDPADDGASMWLEASFAMTVEVKLPAMSNLAVRVWQRAGNVIIRAVCQVRTRALVRSVLAGARAGEQVAAGVEPEPEGDEGAARTQLDVLQLDVGSSREERSQRSETSVKRALGASRLARWARRIRDWRKAG
jgi:hypothetical protein